MTTYNFEISVLIDKGEFNGGVRNSDTHVNFSFAEGSLEAVMGRIMSTIIDEIHHNADFELWVEKGRLKDKIDDLYKKL